MVIMLGFLGFVALMFLLVQLFRLFVENSSRKLLAVGAKHDSLHKKFYEVDLNRYGALFLNVGFIITLAICLTAFEWKTYGEEELPELVYIIEPEEEQLTALPYHQVQPPPPKMPQPEIIVVPNDDPIETTIIDINSEPTEDTVVPEITLPKPVEPDVEVIEGDGIFDILENSAEPVGGLSNFYDYIRKNMKYPAQARRMGVEGKVYVQFVVDKDGTLIDEKAIKGIGAGCDEEAVRVVKEAAKWNAGKQRGRAVKQRMVMPITFKLG